MGDLGGGSLELVQVQGGATGRSATVPLGPLRLLEMQAQAPRSLNRTIDETIGEFAWLGDCAGTDFYPVGGAWRSVARLNMDYSNHPLHVVDGYRMTIPERDLRCYCG